MIRLGIDIGGTFTDFVAIDMENGQAMAWKRLTTPQDPSDAVLLGLEEMLRHYRLSPDKVGIIIHGTTLVANALLERKGAKAAMLTTEGHRDALEIGRELRYDIYDLFIEKPAPLVPRALRFEVRERFTADGRELLPVNPEQVMAIASQLKELQVQSVAVSLLHSYVDPAHEDQVGRLLAEALPDLSISLSASIAPEIREYERASTTAANAYVQPLVSRYLIRLQQRLNQLVPRANFYVMLSGGGFATPERAADVPIQLVESGPAGGALAACHYASPSGHQDLIAFDMGGTTAKLCLITGGTPARTYETEVARRHRFKRDSGLPLLVPTIHLLEIGAGGGSLASIDRLGLLKVGPTSASSEPGPACYGLGGREATVTDANLFLGYLNPGFFLGGKMSLDRAAAEEALARTGRAAGMSALETARGIHEIVNENMAIATRRHVTEQGRDPRRYALVPTGGCGPIHAYGLGKRLKLTSIIYPPAAGVASALGCLVAPARVELARSWLVPLQGLKWAEVKGLYAKLTAEAGELLAQANVAPESITWLWSADMRYVGQGFQVDVPLPPDAVAREAREELAAAFGQAYQRSFGRSLDVPVEVVTWRLTGVGPGANVRIESLGEESAKSTGSALKERRPVYFAETSDYVDCPVYDRYALSVGSRIAGPAIIEERESTVVIGPAGKAVMDQGYNLITTLE